jgi:hypothetical protein
MSYWGWKQHTTSAQIQDPRKIKVTTTMALKYKKGGGWLTTVMSNKSRIRIRATRPILIYSTRSNILAAAPGVEKVFALEPDA